jgi:DNA-binding beta-propeller fold protein YncE
MSATSSLPSADLLYVTLDDDTIATYDTTGNVGSVILATKAIFASTNLKQPGGLAFDSSGNLYAANNVDYSISKFDSSGAYVSRIFSENGSLSIPQGLAFDSTGNLYAANLDNSTISKFNSSGTFLTSWSTGASARAFPFPPAPAFLAFRPVSVPEPSTYALAAIATGVMAYLACRRKARIA